MLLSPGWAVLDPLLPALDPGFSKSVEASSKLRRAITTLAVGLAATPPQDKPIKLVDHCDEKDWDTVAPGLCNVQAGGTTLAQFGAALAQGGDGNWWIDNRSLTINEGDTLVVDNVGGEFHTFTHVNQFGRGFGFFDAALPPTTEKDFDPATAPADANLAAVGPNDALRRVGGLTAGTYRFQCLIHPWMRTTVTVTKG